METKYSRMELTHTLVRFVSASLFYEKPMCLFKEKMATSVTCTLVSNLTFLVVFIPLAESKHAGEVRYVKRVCKLHAVFISVFVASQVQI